MYRMQKLTAPPPSTTAKAASAPAHYEEAEVDWGCFKTSGESTGCRYIGCADYCNTENCNTAAQCTSTEYFESPLSCCDKHDYDGYVGYEGDAPPALTSLQIGSCEVTQFWIDEPEPVEVVKDSLYKEATFTAVCNVHGGGECGHPFCDSMVLTWQGVKYEARGAASKTNPAAVGCAVEDPLKRTGRQTAAKAAGGPGRRAANKAGAQPPSNTKARKADAAEVAYRREEGPAEYFLGDATIYSGPITISSRKYNIKYHTGFMDWISFWETKLVGITPVKVSAAAAANLYKVNPYTYTLKLNKEEGY